MEDFKSYKGHHVLLFGDSYFTSIIGPNGSGKSNSYGALDLSEDGSDMCRMDAISFVLGIKSSHLRSSHLRDLVYRGRVLKTSMINEDGSATANGADGDANGTPTQERNDPKTAWVMAVYEDDAGDEQQWKRSISASGTSEYRINNRVVTAQQYNQALEDENILIKARNFLVFQGDVEAIAAQSPKDLTRLVEQIAGSLEYKAEYERLRAVQEEAIEAQSYNFQRRRGINAEIKQYTEQKREADNYAKKQDQRDQAIVTHVLWKLHQFQNLIETSETEIQKHQEELKEFKRGITKYEQRVDDARKEQAKHGREVAKTERSIKTKERDADEKERALLPIKEKILLTSENITKLQSRIASIAKERDSKAETVKRLNKDIKTVDKAESTWEAEWQKLQQHKKQALTDADLQQYNKLKEDVSKRTSDDQTQADNMTRQLRADSETVNSLKSRVATLETRAEELKQELASISDTHDVVSTTIQQTTKDIDTKKNSFKSLHSERKRVQQLRTEHDEKLQEVLTKLLEAEDGRKQSDKELKMKATVADMKRIFPGVKGRVHELCRPKQKKYEEAVSTVLGRHLDAIVVDNEKTARECIQFLRDQRRGQATFIPLETIQGTSIKSNLKGIHKGTRMAIDIIDYDKLYDPAMSYVCGNAIVCDELSIARFLCYDRGIEAKAVTLEGAVIHKGGLMTGGRGKTQHSKRWEDADVDNLRKLADKLRNDLASLPEGRRNAAEEENLQGEISGLEYRLSSAKEELVALGRNADGKTMELTHVQKELKEAEPNFKGRKRELDALHQQLSATKDAIGKVEDDVFGAFCQRLGYGNIREYEAQQGSLQQEAAQKRLEFRQQKSRLESRRLFEQQQLKELEDRISGLQTKMGKDQASATDLQSQEQDIAHETDILGAELDDLKEALEEQQAEHSKASEKVSEQRRELHKRSKSVEGTLREVERLEADKQRTAVDRYALLRRCKVEDITIPLTNESQGLDQLPIDGIQRQDPDAMDTADDDTMGDGAQDSVIDYGIEIDFDELDDDLKDVRETILS